MSLIFCAWVSEKDKKSEMLNVKIADNFIITVLTVKKIKVFYWAKRFLGLKHSFELAESARGQ